MSGELWYLNKLVGFAIQSSYMQTIDNQLPPDMAKILGYQSAIQSEMEICVHHSGTGVSLMKSIDHKEPGHETFSMNS